MSHSIDDTASNDSASDDTASDDTASENRLAAFIAGLSTAPEQLRAYRENAEAAMDAARLGEDEKAVLRSGDWHAICEFLGDPGIRPLAGAQGGGDPGGEGG